MELNTNSFTVRLYKFVYGLKHDEYLPDNLCPFFWKMVLAFIFVVPLTILAIPTFILEKIVKDEGPSELFWKALIGIVLYFVVGVTFSMIYGLIYLLFGYTFINQWGHELFIKFALIGVVLSVTTLYLYLIIRYKESNKSTPTFIKVVGEFTKAKYNKYCPKITWTQD